MNRRIMAELGEVAHYLDVLDYTRPPEPSRDGEHTVHLIFDRAGRCVDKQGVALDEQTQRTQLLQVAALALLRVQRIDEAAEDPYPVGPTDEQRSRH